MSLKNAIEALSAHDGDYDPSISAHVSCYQTREGQVVLELEFVDADSGDYDRTELYELTVRELN